MGPIANDPDREDVRRVRAGEVDAFEGIVRRWQAPLVNLAYRFCRDRGVAEEMAQEAFLRAFRKLDLWRDTARFSTWLFSVALNVYRSEMRRGRLPELPLLQDREPAAAGNPAAEIVREQTGEVVRRTVSRLPARYRDTLILVYFEEMDVKGAASVLGVPEGTVKARLHRGREMLRKRLSGLVRGLRSAEAT
jgi:RNA polymerase sigma-70 factor (ECF subfamily)